jgi:hypothetical protein
MCDLFLSAGWGGLTTLLIIAMRPVARRKTMPKVLPNNMATVASTRPSNKRVMTMMTCRDNRRKSLNKGLLGKSEAGEVDETSEWLKRQVLRALRVLETRRLPPEEVKEGFYRLTDPQGKHTVVSRPSL